MRMFIAALLTFLSLHFPTPLWAQATAAKESASPREVVDRWLEFHRTGQRQEAAALAQDSIHHRAKYLLSAKRDSGVRTSRSLASPRVAAVMTTSLGDDREQVLLFWLANRGGVWRISKSYSLEKRLAEERLRGFLEAGDVRWRVRREDLAGDWHSGPGQPPSSDGTVCGSHLRLDSESRFQLWTWGPAGPPPEHNTGTQGDWRVAQDRIVFSDRVRSYKYEIVWVSDSLLVIEAQGEPGEPNYQTSYQRADD